MRTKTNFSEPFMGWHEMTFILAVLPHHEFLQGEEARPQIFYQEGGVSRAVLQLEQRIGKAVQNNAF